MLAGEENIVVVLAANPPAVDAIIGRCQTLTGDTARHAASGRGFGEPIVAAIEASDAG
jgi:hypothetical protein